MSMQDQLQTLLRQAYSIADDLRVLASWEISYDEAAEIIDRGRLPTALVELGADGAYALSTWQSFWFCQLRFADRKTKLIVRPLVAKAGYELILLEEVQP